MLYVMGMRNETPTDKATRYVASLRPAMHVEAARIARQHIAEGTHLDDARAILAALGEA